MLASGRNWIGPRTIVTRGPGKVKKQVALGNNFDHGAESAWGTLSKGMEPLGMVIYFHVGVMDPVKNNWRSESMNVTSFQENKHETQSGPGPSRRL